MAFDVAIVIVLGCWQLRPGKTGKLTDKQPCVFQLLYQPVYSVSVPLASLFPKPQQY